MEIIVTMDTKNKIQVKEIIFLLRYSFQLLLSDNNIYVTSVAYTKIRRINSVIVLFSKDYKGFYILI